MRAQMDFNARPHEGKASARECFARGVDTIAAFANERRRSHIAKERDLGRGLSARAASSCRGDVAAGCVYVYIWLPACLRVCVHMHF